MATQRTKILLAATAVLLTAGVAAAVHWARPLLALHELQTALEARDEAAVAQVVDFDALRSNVTDYVQYRIEKQNQDKFLGGLRSAVQGVVAEILIGALATPEGLIHLSCDTRPDGSVDTSPKPPGTPCKIEARVHNPQYLSSTRFKVMAERPDEGDMGMILDRQADGAWRLVGLTGSGPVSK